MGLIFLDEERKKRNREEQKLVQDCLKYLKLIGCVAFRNNAGIVFLKNSDGSKRAIRMGLVGASDIVGAMPDGRFLAIECKTKKGRLTASQKRFLDDIQRLGGVSFVVRSMNDLFENLNKYYNVSGIDLSLSKQTKEKQKNVNVNTMNMRPKTTRRM